MIFIQQIVFDTATLVEDPRANPWLARERADECVYSRLPPRKPWPKGRTIPDANLRAQEILKFSNDKTVQRNPEPRNKIWKAFQSRKYDVATKILQDSKTLNRNTQILPFDGGTAHNKRWKRGKVGGGLVASLILQTQKGMKPFLTKEKGKVGWAKGGWANCAKKLGGIRGIPAWIYTLTDTSATQTTAALPYNATAAQVQAAIQSALTTNWSTATVLGSTGGPFTITNGVNGVQTPLIGSSLTLAPASSVVITPTQVGDSSLPEVQYIRLTLNPIALQNSWTASSSPDILTGNLSLDTASIEEVMGNAPSICTTLSIQVIPVGGEAFTVYQRNFTIDNDLIDGAPSIPTPGVSYYTTVESDARYTRSTSIYVERNSTGNSVQHIVTAGVGANNIIYLITNAPSTVVLNFDNGTFDGQTVTYKPDAAISSITYSDNVAGVLTPDNITAETSLSFMWDGTNSVWFPI